MRVEGEVFRVWGVGVGVETLLLSYGMPFNSDDRDPVAMRVAVPCEKNVLRGLRIK